MNLRTKVFLASLVILPISLLPFAASAQKSIFQIRTYQYNTSCGTVQSFALLSEEQLEQTCVDRANREAQRQKDQAARQDKVRDICQKEAMPRDINGHYIDCSGIDKR